MRMLPCVTFDPLACIAARKGGPRGHLPEQALPIGSMFLRMRYLEGDRPALRGTSCAALYTLGSATSLDTPSSPPPLRRI